ncbi:endonuclease domain-containing protein [Luteimonas sp. TWI1416]|uniref:endonuclease domain-containing protein n=1 Tax=unclassified Luteimonas TaxID=2629088 RepID=UPI003209B369
MRQGAKRDLARRLRQTMTDAERALWRHLRMRQMAGARFRRQHPIGPYVVDFVCLAQGLVIEVDGGQHAESTSDAARDAFLRAQGYRVLRFWNHDVLGNPEGVWLRIRQALSEEGMPGCQ